jgi:hypothetical protein
MHVSLSGFLSNALGYIASQTPPCAYIQGHYTNGPLYNA